MSMMIDYIKRNDMEVSHFLQENHSLLGKEKARDKDFEVINVHF